MKQKFYSVFVIVAILWIILIAGCVKDDSEKLTVAMSQFNSGLCGDIDKDIIIFYPDIVNYTRIQSNISLRDVCYIENAEPTDEKIILCEDVSNSTVNFCEEGCYEISAKEACYRLAFGDFKSYPQPPSRGTIVKIETCQKISDFRDNCYYLVAVNIENTSVCDMISSQSRSDLCKENAV